MDKKVARLFDHLSDDFIELLARLDGMNHELLEKSPAPGKWSATQVMYHLNSAESLSVKYVAKKRLAAPQLKRTGLVAWLRLMAARISFYVPIKYRAPKFLGAMPEHVAYSDIKETWLQTRHELAALLESLKEDEIRKPIFLQPFFGRLNIYQMLGFMQTHFNRHRKQMMKAIKALK